jgi:hypothetical protein
MSFRFSFRVFRIFRGAWFLSGLCFSAPSRLPGFAVSPRLPGPPAQPGNNLRFLKDFLFGFGLRRVL